MPERADPEFRADLRVLHESFLAVQDLSFIGLAGVRAELLRHLSNRLRVREYLRACPQIASVPVARPVFAAGLPRTCTTLLHDLLAAVPGHRAPLLWELLAPCPPGAGRDIPGQNEPGQRVRSAERLVTLADLAAPSMRVIHPLDARAPEECVFALPHSMYWLARARLPGYLDWLGRRDATADYGYLRQQLQILQRQQPARRWICKSPFHLCNLDALLRVFPDATIVWTHRDPAVALASWCSLAEVTVRLHNRSVDLGVLGQDWLQMWAGAMTRATGVRAGTVRPFIDVSFTRLAAGPLLLLDEVCRGLGAGLIPAARERIAARARRPGTAGQRAHHYSLARYGLTPQSVREAIPGYPGARG